VLRIGTDNAGSTLNHLGEKSTLHTEQCRGGWSSGGVLCLASFSLASICCGRPAEEFRPARVLAVPFADTRLFPKVTAGAEALIFVSSSKKLALRAVPVSVKSACL
jgi:hypothetical protein